MNKISLKSKNAYQRFIRLKTGHSNFAKVSCKGSRYFHQG